MQTLEHITEDEMIACFLKGELDSIRFTSDLRKEMEGLSMSREIVTNPNFLNQSDNTLRRKLFGKFRGYEENRELFENFPTDVRWTRVQLTSQEMLHIRYIDYSYWNEISKGTRLPSLAAETIKSGEEVFGVSNENFLKAAEFLREGGEFPELILVARNESSPLVVLEGHLRLTAYALAPEAIPDRLTAIAGFSEKLTRWGEY